MRTRQIAALKRLVGAEKIRRREAKHQVRIRRVLNSVRRCPPPALARPHVVTGFAPVYGEKTEWEIPPRPPRRAPRPGSGGSPLLRAPRAQRRFRRGGLGVGGEMLV